MNTNFGMSSNASAHVERGTHSVGTGLPHVGELFIQRVAPSGEILHEFTARNLLTNQGATYMLNRAFFPTTTNSNNYAAHETGGQGSGLFMGLFKATHTAAATNVPTTFNHSGIGENYQYYATNPLPAYPGTAVNIGDISASTTRELVNSPTLDFVITNGGGSTPSGQPVSAVGGVFIISNSTNNEDASGSYSNANDLLVSVAAFSGGVAVNVDDTLKVTYRHTFS